MSFAKGLTSGLTTGAAMRASKAAKAGDKAPVLEASPLERAGSWVKDKLSGLTADAAPSSAPVVAGGSGDVGLMERLKAGNIDDPKSEAYRRWGKGAVVAPVGDASAVVDPDAANPDGTYTNDMWAQAPDFGADDNPRWQEFENTRGGF